MYSRLFLCCYYYRRFNLDYSFQISGSPIMIPLPLNVRLVIFQILLVATGTTRRNSLETPIKDIYNQCPLSITLALTTMPDLR